MNRRAFLLGCAATVVVASVGTPAWADGPDKFTSMKISFSKALGRYAKRNNLAAKARPLSPPTTVTEYRAAYKNISEVANQRAAARAAAAATAASEAESKAIWGLAGGLGRLGSRVVKGLNFIGLGLTFIAAAGELWSWYAGRKADETALNSCPLNKVCTVTLSNGQRYVTTTTREYADSASNWSLYQKNWSATSNVRAPTVPGQAGYYIVHWTWQPHNGWTVDTFDPQLEYSPYVRGVGNTVLAQQLQDEGYLDKPLTKADMALLLDAMVGGAVKSDPDLWPAAWSDPATEAARPVVTADDFADTDGGGLTLGHLMTPWSSTTSTGGYQLLDPDVVADTGTDTTVDPATGEPTTPGTGGGTGTGTGSGSQPYPTGDAVEPDNVPDLPGFSAFADPFKNLFNPFGQAFAGSGSCSAFQIPGSYNGVDLSATVNFCPVIEPIAPAIVVASAAIGAWMSIDNILEA